MKDKLQKNEWIINKAKENQIQTNIQEKDQRNDEKETENQNKKS